jgi:hypothetical protein
MCPTCGPMQRRTKERDAFHHDAGRRGAAVRAGAWPKAPSRSTTSPSRRRWTGTPSIPTTRRPSAIRRRGCTRATWTASARPRTFRTWPPPTAWSSISTTGPSTRRSTPFCSLNSSSKSARTLAKEKGIASGDKVKVRSNRGFIKAVAVVTKRIKTLDVDGKKVHTIGIPHPLWLHGGHQAGLHHQHADAVTLATPIAQTPEYKAFLVNIIETMMHAHSVRCPPRGRCLLRDGPSGGMTWHCNR